MQTSNSVNFSHFLSPRISARRLGGYIKLQNEIAKIVREFVRRRSSAKREKEREREREREREGYEGEGEWKSCQASPRRGTETATRAKLTTQKRQPRFSSRPRCPHFPASKFKCSYFSFVSYNCALPRATGGGGGLQGRTKNRSGTREGRGRRQFFQRGNEKKRGISGRGFLKIPGGNWLMANLITEETVVGSSWRPRRWLIATRRDNPLIHLTN